MMRQATLTTWTAGILTLICATMTMAASTQEQPQPNQTTGDIVAVTVYRGEALVTRRVEVPGPAGLKEIVVTRLPQQIIPGSLYAEAGPGVTVRSVRYRTRAVPADVRDQVAQLEAQIQQTRDQIKQIEQAQKVIDQEQAYMDKLAHFTAATANAELTKGVLSADTLTKLTEFQFDKRQDLAQRQLKSEFAKRELNEKLELLQRKRSKVTNSSDQTAREAVVFVDVQKPGSALALRYLVDDASWSPSYNVRTDHVHTDADHQVVTVEYYASVRQMSGEDWHDVAMTLSTATPSMAAQAPDLEPITLSLASARAAGRSGLSQKLASQPASAAVSLDMLKSQISRQRKQLEQQRGQQGAKAPSGFFVVGQWSDSELRAPGQPAPSAAYDTKLNKLAGKLQLLEIQAAPGQARQPGEKAAHPQEAVSVTYKVAEKTSLPSRSDRQLIRIASLPMKGEFYRLAEPVLTPHVYRQASVKNTSDRVLLAGPISAYVDGRFVGRGAIPTVAAGETFTVGFGIDPSLRADRDLVKKDETIRGGNRVITLNYALTLQNFGDKPASVRVKDRIPTTSRDHQFTVDLINTKPDLSDDATYQKQQREKGILRWDITVPAGTTDTNASRVTYQYTLAYDKQMTVTGLPLRH